MTAWIGTENDGLTKFDGTNWTTYNTWNSQLPGDNVRSIAIDGNGAKWVGTVTYNYGGLAKFDGINWIIYNVSNSGLPLYSVTTITIDENSTKWIGTDGMAVFNENGIPVSVKEYIKTENNVKVFPNPVKDHFNIEIPAGMNISYIEIFTIQGNVIKSLKITNNQNSIDMRNLPGGIYIIRLHTDQGVVVKKMVKQ
jgi:ligand-binding sensor domain-containing protein